jgi:hypothetical protein
MSRGQTTIGFVDIGDTPYPEMVGAGRQTGNGLYEFRVEQSGSTRAHTHSQE